MKTTVKCIATMYIDKSEYTDTDLDNLWTDIQDFCYDGGLKKLPINVEIEVKEVESED